MPTMLQAAPASQAPQVAALVTWQSHLGPEWALACLRQLQVKMALLWLGGSAWRLGLMDIVESLDRCNKLMLL